MDPVDPLHSEPHGEVAADGLMELLDHASGRLHGPPRRLRP